MRFLMVVAIFVCSIIFITVYSQSHQWIFSFVSNQEYSLYNEENDKIPRFSRKKIQTSTKCRTSPSSLMEQSRRHIVETVRDQWLFLKSQIRFLQRLSSNVTIGENIWKKFNKTLKYMISHGSEYSRVLELEIDKLSQLDGWYTWRKKESKKLKDIVRKRLYNLQNPKNCTESPVFICNLTNPSGFASGAHDVLWCFMEAYKDNRRLVLHSSHWHYAPGGWENLFEPLSETCTNSPLGIELSTSENNNRFRWIMRTLPLDLGSKIILLHGNPLAWWYGQFLMYLMRPNLELRLSLDNLEERINFTDPIVGIHVRRTDKIGTEAKSHQLEEYMEHVENYFLSLELELSQSIKRRVFIATDDPKVIDECHNGFPEYECLYNFGSAESAAHLETRYNNNSLWNLVLDIFALTRTNYIVCTFSSGLCRLAFELKMGFDDESIDASSKAASLDIYHHYAWVTPPARKALYNHRPKSSREIPFRKGDVLIHKDEYCTVNAALKGKTRNGFLKMISNKNELLEGFIPTYKTRETFQMYAYKTSN